MTYRTFRDLFLALTDGELEVVRHCVANYSNDPLVDAMDQLDVARGSYERSLENVAAAERNADNWRQNVAEAERRVYKAAWDLVKEAEQPLPEDPDQVPTVQP